MRVVSLVPSLTETLFALGAGDAVVGITDFCIFPEGIDRPRVGGTNASLASASDKSTTRTRLSLARTTRSPITR